MLNENKCFVLVLRDFLIYVYVTNFVGLDFVFEIYT